MRSHLKEQNEQITRLLRLWQAGDRDAEATLFELLLPQLRRIAKRQFYGERADHTLQPTALVNEAFLRLARSKHIDWQDRSHFFAIAGRVMRRYLIDHARRRPHVDLIALDAIPEGLLKGRSRNDVVIQMDVLLDKLEKQNPRWCKVVELKFFLGLTDQEAAHALDTSLHTLQRRWYRARHWLHEQLEAKNSAEPDEHRSPTRKRSKAQKKRS
jgi:RNA polymerase sigma-70 factor (ECF subfamily)